MVVLFVLNRWALEILFQSWQGYLFLAPLGLNYPLLPFILGMDDVIFQLLVVGQQVPGGVVGFHGLSVVMTGTGQFVPSSYLDGLIGVCD